MFVSFEDLSADPAVRGFLHTPGNCNGCGIVLTHGAGANCQAKLLTELSGALADTGFTVLRIDLPFRQARRFGPPHPGFAERDRQGLRRAARVVADLPVGHKARGTKVTPAEAPSPSRVFLGGHSYGGRQASMLLAEDPSLADGLLLLSYPLHPPKKPTELRTKHFPRITKPAFFVHGTRDPFATIPELQSALELIPAPHTLLDIENAAHDLLPKKSVSDLPVRIADAFRSWIL
jgi:uncharacterized protein